MLGVLGSGIGALGCHQSRHQAGFKISHGTVMQWSPSDESAVTIKRLFPGLHCFVVESFVAGMGATGDVFPVGCVHGGVRH